MLDAIFRIYGARQYESYMLVNLIIRWAAKIVFIQIVICSINEKVSYFT